MRLILAIAVFAVAVTLAVAWPAAPADARESLTVKIGKNAALVEGGETVIVKVRVRCDPGWTVLEAFVYVTQNDNQSQFASIPVPCDGKQHWFEVSVAAEPDLGPFHPGDAQASAYVLLEDATGTSISTSPTRQITIR